MLIIVEFLESILFIRNYCFYMWSLATTLSVFAVLRHAVFFLYFLLLYFCILFLVLSSRYMEFFNAINSFLRSISCLQYFLLHYLLLLYPLVSCCSFVCSGFIFLPNLISIHFGMLFSIHKRCCYLLSVFV